MEDMGILARDERQLILIYNGKSQIGKEALGFATSADDAVQTIDICETNLGDSIWVEIADGLGENLGDILSPDHPDAPKVDHARFDTDDWLKILNKSPEVFQKPILIKGERFKQINTPSEVMKFIEVDSAGLEKNPIGEPPTTQSTTDGENFVED